LPIPLCRADMARFENHGATVLVMRRRVMAKKAKKLRQVAITPHPNPFVAAYAARLARQVSQELASPRKGSIQRKKARKSGK
jgi:hypothetical protein